MNTRKPATAADVDNRSRLLHAATDAFAEYGFEGASLRAIADNAGVSFQLIAYYFGSKEELWVATVDYLFERYLETGKGLGFTPSGNLHEQFHNHLRLLLTDLLQRPQLHKICVQEHLPNSARFRNIIRAEAPAHVHEPRSAVLSRSRAARHRRAVHGGRDLLAVVLDLQSQYVATTDFVEHTLGVPAGSPKAVEAAGRPDVRDPHGEARPSSRRMSDERAGRTPRAEGRRAAERRRSCTRGRTSNDGRAEAHASKQLETENLQLKQLVGSLSLEKKLLLERLAALEPAAKK